MESESPQWKVVGPEGDFHLICTTLHEQDEARARFIAASPQMAEALLAGMDMQKPGDIWSVDPGKIQKFLKLARKALKLAGYTESTATDR